MNEQTFAENQGTACTLEAINLEIGQLSNSPQLLDSIFHLNRKQVLQYFSREFDPSERNDILLKFSAQLNDTRELKTKCTPTELINLKVGDLAFYCLAKTEKFPFALATGRQNCTEPNISNEIEIPTNFIYYTSFERDQLANNFQKYLVSKQRQKYLKKIGYD